MTRLVLVGCGHAHVEVLRRLAERPVAGVRVSVVSRVPAAAYSGMLPGVVAGHYGANDLLIPVAPLAARAGAACLLGTATALDPEARVLRLADGRRLDYDLLSLDIGSTPDTRGAPPLGERILPVKPLETFLPALEAAEARLPGQRPARVAVVGAGVAGVEMALALRHRWAAAGREVEIALIERGKEIVPGLPRAARRKLEAACRAADVGMRTGTTKPGEVDLALWTTGAAAPDWLGGTGLALDGRGFVRVEPTLRAVGRADVFATGDVAAIEGSPRPKAGVFAVRQGPVLAENLRAALTGGHLRPYRPQRAWLSLIATGPRHAVATRNGLTASGGWVWWLKDRIDRGFIARYRLDPGSAPPCAVAEEADGEPAGR